MARITIEELYRGDEYNVMGNALAELMTVICYTLNAVDKDPKFW